jgi:uncharacterized protein involved in exopolysaccharide biosynthesis
MVELKVISPSSQIASTCIRAVVEQIQMMQAQLAEPLIKEAEIKLASDNERIDAARKVISRAQNGSISVAYLSVRDELAYYLADREKTIYFISSVKNRGATLMSPIYAPDEPVPSKKILILILGLLGGCFLGALTALTRPILAKFNNKLLGLK